MSNQYMKTTWTKGGDEEKALRVGAEKFRIETEITDYVNKVCHGGKKVRTVNMISGKLRSMGIHYKKRFSVEQREKFAAEKKEEKKEIIIIRQKKEIIELNKDMKELLDNRMGTEKIKEMIYHCQGVEHKDVPVWLAKKRDKTEGVPFLMSSDLHWDEVVQPKQNAAGNPYNRKIAADRLDHTVRTAIHMAKKHVGNPDYDGFFWGWAGDFLSGMIHEELTNTNQYPITKSLVDLKRRLITWIKILKAPPRRPKGMRTGPFTEGGFGRVHIAGVIGNHPRITPKPQSKNKVFNNWEWLLYHLVAEHFEDDPDVTFQIPEQADVQFSICGKRFLMTHGDQFRGGNGIAGIISPLMIGYARKLRRQVSIGKPFDVMLVAHFHRQFKSSTLWTNGSQIGYNEFASNGNFEYEPPMQIFCVIDPDGFVSHWWDILCARNEKQQVEEKTVDVFQARRKK